MMFGSFISGAASIIGGGINALSGRASRNQLQDQYNQNVALQKEFAQNGIRWRVEDAKAAGLHPLAAMGFSGTSYQPVTTSGVVDTSLGDGIANFGNAIGQGWNRAAEAKQTRQERLLEYQYRANQLIQQQKHGNAQADLMSAQTRYYDALTLQVLGSQRAVARAGLPPAMPSKAGSAFPGQGDSGQKDLVEIQPAKPISPVSGYPGTEAGFDRDRRIIATDDGGYVIARSQALEEALEDDPIGIIGWHYRNTLPALWDSQGSAPPKSLLPKGARSWVFNSGRMAWYPDNHRYGRRVWDYLNPKNW